MNHPTVLLPAAHRAISSSLARFGYEVLMASDKTEALALLRASRGITVLVADVDADGLTLARDARAIRANLGVVYTAMTPHRVAERERVPDAPILRSPYGAHQLASVISGLGRRVLDDPLAA